MQIIIRAGDQFANTSCTIKLRRHDVVVVVVIKRMIRKKGSFIQIPGIPDSFSGHV
jgi:hypothetical protein